MGGAYLTKPIKEKFSEDESLPHVEYGVSGMQGWRMSMEDAHCCVPNVKETNNGLYGVFDGHGGREVAEYCALNFEKFLLDTPGFEEGDMKAALKQAFMNIDEALLSDEVIEELRKLGGYDENGEENDEDEEVEDEAQMLLKEAGMPLEQVLQQFKEAAQQKLDEKFSNGCNEEKEEEDNEEKQIVEEEVTKSSKSRKQKKPVKHQESAKEEKTPVVGGTSLVESSSSNGESHTNGSSGKQDEDANVEENEEKEESKEEKKEEAVENEEEDLEDEASDEEDDEDDSEVDSDDEFEDSDGIEFQQGTEESGKDSGTTAIVALVHEGTLYVANAGDSRCVLCRNGKAVEMSFDHKPEDEPEKSRIEGAGSKITADGRVNGGLNLSRAIGDHIYKQNKDLSPEEQAITALPDIKQEKLTKDDEFMVLACDGIWGVMTNEEVVEYIYNRLEETKDEQIPLSKICEEIFDRCLAPDTENDGSGCDNMTCLIVRFKHNSDNKKRPLSDSQQEENTSQKSKKIKHSAD